MGNINNQNINNEKISIIVPIYNSEKYIEKCINSVIAQSFENWELLLVDDASSDDSVELCRKYVLDDRISVLEKEHAGVAAARNYGIEHASGLYMLFLDSDDELTPDACAILIKNIHDADICVAGYNRISDNYIENIFPTMYYGNIRDSETFFNECLDKALLQAPWCKLFKKEIVTRHHIKFPFGMSYGEDSYFVYEYLRHVNKIALIDQSAYMYYVRTESLSHGLKKDKYKINVQLNKMKADLRQYYGFEYKKHFIIDNRNSFAALVNDVAYEKKRTIVYKTISDAIDNEMTKKAFEYHLYTGYKQEVLKTFVRYKLVGICIVFSHMNKMLHRINRRLGKRNENIIMGLLGKKPR